MEIVKFLKFCEFDADDAIISKAISCASSASIGKGRRSLNASQVVAPEKLIGKALDRYGNRPAQASSAKSEKL